MAERVSYSYQNKWCTYIQLIGSSPGITKMNNSEI